VKTIVLFYESIGTMFNKEMLIYKILEINTPHMNQLQLNNISDMQGRRNVFTKTIIIIYKKKEITSK
jgi:hypothetical protein